MFHLLYPSAQYFICLSSLLVLEISQGCVGELKLWFVRAMCISLCKRLDVTLHAHPAPKGILRSSGEDQFCTKTLGNEEQRQETTRFSHSVAVMSFSPGQSQLALPFCEPHAFYGSIKTSGVCLAAFSGHRTKSLLSLCI